MGDNEINNYSPTKYSRTTIGLKMSTKDKLDKNRAPGQCYNGFICQLVDLWEEVKQARKDYISNPGKGEVMPIEKGE